MTVRSATEEQENQIPLGHSSEGKKSEWGYEPALDGIRALCVTAVLLYHNGAYTQRWFGGGFAGVEVFFVVSGYLIASLCVVEWSRTGGVSLGDFWSRRAKRLLPALYLVVAVAAFVVSALAPDVITKMRKDMWPGLFYYANWWFVFSEQSYFDIDSRPSPFRHLWSLAVEEQFYIVMPVAFVLLMRFTLTRPDWRPIVALALAAASTSLTWALYEPGKDPSRVYYGTDTRMAGILFGVALALYTQAYGSVLRRVTHLVDAIGVTALLALFVCFVLMDDTDSGTYYYGMLVVDMLSLAIIASCTNRASTVIRPFLSLTPFVYIGQRSYGIYLIHWPIFILTRPGFDIRLDGMPLLLFRLGLTGVLAFLMYSLVENPMRRASYGNFFRLRFIDSRTGKADRQALATLLFTLVVCGALAGSYLFKAPAPEAKVWSLSADSGGSLGGDDAAGSSTAANPDLVFHLDCRTGQDVGPHRIGVTARVGGDKSRVFGATVAGMKDACSLDAGDYLELDPAKVAKHFPDPEAGITMCGSATVPFEVTKLDDSRQMDLSKNIDKRSVIARAAAAERQRSKHYAFSQSPLRWVMTIGQQPKESGPCELYTDTALSGPALTDLHNPLPRYKVPSQEVGGCHCCHMCRQHPKCVAFEHRTLWNTYNGRCWLFSVADASAVKSNETKGITAGIVKESNTAPFLAVGFAPNMTVPRRAEEPFVAPAADSDSHTMHVCLAYRRGVGRLFVNGAPSSRTVKLSTAVARPTAALVGALVDGSTSEQGGLRDVRVYKRMLSDKEVADLYATSGTKGQSYSRTLLLGDSVYCLANVALRKWLPGIRIDCQVGRTVKYLTQQIRKGNIDLKPFDAVVVHVGDNVGGDEILREPEFNDLMPLLLSVPRVFVMNVCGWGARARPETNAMLARVIPAKYPGVVLVDWNAAGCSKSSNIEWFRDNVHPNEQGEEILGALLARVLEQKPASAGPKFDAQTRTDPQAPTAKDKPAAARQGSPSGKTPSKDNNVAAVAPPGDKTRKAE